MIQRFATLIFILFVAACTGEGTGRPVRVKIPSRAHFSQVTDSLAAKHLIRAPFFFKLYAKATGAAGSVKPGTYEFRRGVGWDKVLADLRAGNYLKAKVVIPEGWDLKRIAPRLVSTTELPEDSILKVLQDTVSARRFSVPGPTLEGYLYPATHIFPVDLPLDTVITRMIAPYRKVWTPARRAAADSAHMSEQHVVTLASIVEAEAKKREEMPTISAVYHNRLRLKMPLQADPTVQYTLRQRQASLLYRDIESTAANPYNTYANPGLPPGPIGSPSNVAIDAVLHPARTDVLYFVAKPDGTSVFSRTLNEHNRAKAAIKAMQPQQPATTPGTQPKARGR